MKTACIAALSAFLVLAASSVSATYVPKWVSTYDPGSYTFQRTTAARLLADGSTMIVGEDGGVSRTAVRFDANGTVLTKATFTPADSPFTMQISPFGEIYVVTYGLLMKYDGLTGVAAWAAPATYLVNGTTVTTLTLDPAGNPILAYDVSTTRYVRKYSAVDGSVLWTSSLTVGSGVMSTRAITTDSAGNVIVSSWTGTNVNYNIITAKLLGTDGSALWSATYDRNSDDRPVQLAVDHSDDIFLVGTTLGTGTDIVVVKYTGSSGAEQWRTTSSAPPSVSTETPSAIAVDAENHLFVAGTYTNGSYTDLQFMRFTPSGTRAWSINVNGTRDDTVPSIAIDGFGDVFWTGSTGGASFDTDLVVGKIQGGTGTRPWTQTYNRTSGQNDSGTAVMVSPTGNVYVAGTTYDTFARDDFTFAKYSSSTGSTLAMTHVDGNNAGSHYAKVMALGPSNEIWAGADSPYDVQKFDGATGAGSNYSASTSLGFAAMAVDGTGNHYELTTWGSSNTDYALAKYSAAGAYQWQKYYNGPTSGSDQPKVMTLDGTGKPIISGSSYSTAAGGAIVTIKYDTAGTQQWVHTFNGTVSNGNDTPVAVLTDASNNVFVAGTAYDSGTSYDLVVIKINGTTGAQMWATSLNGSGDDAAFGLVLDSSGNPIVAGRYASNSSADFWAVKLDNATGGTTWNTRVTNASLDEPHAITLDGAGDVILTGVTNSGTYTGDFFTAKLSGSTGAQQWTATYDGGVGVDNAIAVRATSTNDVVVFGTVARAAWQGDDLALIRYTSAGAVGTGPTLYDSGTIDSAQAMVMIGDDPVVLGRNGDRFLLIRYTESLGIGTITLPPAYCNVAYNATVDAGNGTAPYTFSVSSGSLPPGLTLDPSTGVISGTAGTFGAPFTPRIRVTDSTSAYVERDFRIDGFSGSAYLPIASTANPVCGSTTLSVAGSWTSYLWQPNGETTSTIAPTITHPTLFGVKLGDSFSCTTLATQKIDVIQPLSAVTISVAGTTSLCSAPTGGTASVADTGGGTSTHQWGYRTSPGGTITDITGQTGASYLITASHFPGGGTYYVVCRTTPYCGTAATSNEIAITISNATVPSALTATPSGDNQVALSWTGSTGSGIHHYNIYRSSGLCPGGTFTKVGETVALETTWTDTNVINGGAYSYKVTVSGVGGACETGFSNCDDAVAYGSCALAPTFAGATSAATSGCFLRVSWSAATSNCPLAPTVVYNIHRSTTSGFTPGAGNRIASCVTGTSYEDDTVSTGTTYYYVVRAEDSSTGGSGPCNGGNEDTNTVRVNATATSGSGVTTTNYADSFEAPNRPATTPDAYWIEQALSGADHLSQSTCKSSSTNTSYKWGNTSTCPGSYATYVTSQLTLGGDGSVSSSINGFALSAAQSNHRLKFKQYYVTESRYDGVALYYSTTGASGTFTIVPDTVTAGKPYIITGPYINTMYTDGGHRAWTGSAASWAQVVVNLDNLAGQTVWFRWRYYSDSIVTAEGYYIDDVQLTADTPVACGTPPGAVQAFTATSTNTANLLEWQNPSGTYGSTMIRFRTDTFPTSTADGTLATTRTGTAGDHDSWSHSGLTNNTTYYYSAFVDDGTGVWSRRRTVAARPQAVTGPVKWVYATGATKVTRPGGSAYTVANDRTVHAMNAGTSGGQWPSAWKPFFLTAASLARPITTSFTLGTATKEVYLGALDGSVSCLDGDTGAQIWRTSSAIGDAVLGATNSTTTLTFAGTRNASTDNSVVALDATSGSTAWTFDNGGSSNAIGIISGEIAVEPDDTAYFASRAKTGGSSDTVWALSFTGTSATKVWSTAIGDSDSTPVLTSTRVYVDNRAGVLYALDRTTGAVAWSYGANDGAVQGPLQVDAASGRIYFATANKLWSITDAGSSATLNWTVTIAKPAAALFTGTALLAGSADGKLYQLTNLTNPTPTSTSLTLGTGTAAIGAPTYDATNTMVYAGSDAGAIYGVALPLP